MMICSPRRSASRREGKDAAGARRAQRPDRARERTSACPTRRNRARGDRDPAATFSGPVILVDTAVWIDHFRDGDPHLAELLDRDVVLAHPWVTGELALDHLRGRAEILRLLHDLPQATVATGAELLQFIEHHELYGLGIGYVDAQLLAATTRRSGLTTDDCTRQHRPWARPTHLVRVGEPPACLGRRGRARYGAAARP